jgi:hypothetical protein
MEMRRRPMSEGGELAVDDDGCDGPEASHFTHLKAFPGLLAVADLQQRTEFGNGCGDIQGLCKCGKRLTLSEWTGKVTLCPPNSLLSSLIRSGH